MKKQVEISPQSQAILPYQTLEDTQANIQNALSTNSCPGCKRDALDCMYITDSGHPHLLFIEIQSQPSRIFICSSCASRIEEIKFEAHLPEEWYPPVAVITLTVCTDDPMLLLTDVLEDIKNERQDTIQNVAPVAKHTKLGEATDEQIYFLAEYYKNTTPDYVPPSMEDNLEPTIPLPKTKKEKSLMRLLIRMMNDADKKPKEPAAPSHHCIKRGRFKNRALQYDAFYLEPDRSELIDQTITDLIARGIIQEHLPTGTGKRGRQARWLTSAYALPIHPELYDCIYE